VDDVTPAPGVPPEPQRAVAPGQREQSSVRAPGSPPAAPTPQPEMSTANRDLYIAFYREFVPKLVAFLVFLGASLNDAADLAQETMIDAYRSWSEIEYPRAWAKRVASRKYLRRVAQLEELPEPDAPSPLLPSGLEVSEWEGRHEVLRLLAELPPRQRQVMAWSYDGYTASEIAAELSMTVDAVRTNLMRARRALASKLGLREGGPQ
jgi:RNA polymerase sigma factor (sigma-70 family)